MARTTQPPRTDRGRVRKGPPTWLWIVGPVVAVAAVIAVFALRQGDDSPRSVGALDAMSNDPGVVHVHGLGVNPANGDVYAATHMGVFHITADGEATRIANRYQDTMGFTVVGSDHFLASGHPDLREDLPPLLGLLESRDAGRTWTKKSLLGESDFHVLRYAHKTIYGYDSTSSALMVSRDGVRWDTRSKVTLGDFAVSPEDPNEIVATTPGGLERSTDGGRTWKRIDGPLRPVFVAWDTKDRLLLLDVDGQLHVSPDAGSDWKAHGSAVGRPEALLANGDKVYAAAGGAIFVSDDAGRRWESSPGISGMRGRSPGVPFAP